MKRKIIKIDEKKCNGCGLCADACHEGAIKMVEGKAKLIRDDYCDGLGDCLPVCPTSAISFEVREALPYDEQAVKQNINSHPQGCPGMQGKKLHPQIPQQPIDSRPCQSRLGQWPVQIKLAPVNAPYFQNADLLIAADCTAYAYGNFHDKFMKGKITLIGCPKLDDVDYSEKLAEIITHNNINKILITRMEVPCCGGIVNAVKAALQKSGKIIPWQIVTISTEGEILPDEII